MTSYTLKLSILLVLICGKLNACKCSVELLNSESLKEYEFIAHVKIDSIYNTSKLSPMKDNYYMVKFSIKTLYKGDSISNIPVSGIHPKSKTGYASCQTTFAKNEERILFARRFNGLLNIHLCSLTELYSNKLGEKDWRYKRGIKEKEFLDKYYNKDICYNHPENGKHETYYPNGNIETISFYKDGLLDSLRTIYYSNGTLMSKESFRSGELNGNSLWYSRSGEVEKHYKYYNNKPIDTCFRYNYLNNVEYKAVFKKDGYIIAHNYDSKGYIEKCTIRDPQKDKIFTLKLYLSGDVKYKHIQNLDGIDIYSASYYKSGKINREWNYNPSKDDISLEFKHFSESGKLLEHKFHTKEGKWIDKTQN